SISRPPRFQWPISGTAWSRFWSYKIPLKARTVWYRILHNRIPHRGILHFIFPDKTPTNLCSRCSIHPDSIFHFFFGCPSILPAWSHFLPLLTPLPIFNLNSFLSELCHSLQNLPRRFPQRWLSDVQLQSLSFIQIVMCLIQAIWTHHWTNIFHDVPFNHNIIIATANKLKQFDSEQTLYLQP
ncbi:hypothetical protein EDC94DRAFT_528360, partial [Helicostylum pulchrum]